MGEVVHVSGCEVTGEQGTNEECISTLETLLEKAKNGDVVGVSVAVQHADGSTTAWHGGFTHNSRIAGELMALVMRLLA